MGLFYLGPLCGPLFAPVIGGALAQKWSWRATMWFIAIYGGMQYSFTDISRLLFPFTHATLLTRILRNNLHAHFACPPRDVEEEKQWR